MNIQHQIQQHQKENSLLVCSCFVSTCPIFSIVVSNLEPFAFTIASSYTKHSGRSSYRSSTIEQEPIWPPSNSPNVLPISFFRLVLQQRLAFLRQLVQRRLVSPRQLVQQQLVQRQLVLQQLVQQQLVRRQLVSLQRLVQRQLVQQQLVLRQLVQQQLARRQLVLRQLVQQRLVQ